VCRNCGALVSPGETVCPQCGALLGDQPLRAAERSFYDREAMRFARAIFQRPATFTFVFLIANVFIFLLMEMAGGSQSEPVLREFGAKYNSLIDEGQWWRFVTPVFLHIGPIHLLANMYGLWVLGPYVERLYGSAKFVVFWVVAGVAGVAASYLTVLPPGTAVGPIARFLFRANDGPSAGASGALFGLIGVLFIFGIKYRQELPEGFKQAFGTGMLPTILINIFIGYSLPFIDNAAHLGGLAAGMAMAALVGYKRPGARGPVALAWHVLQIAALALIIASFVMVVLQPGFTRQAREIMAYRAAMDSGKAAFARAFDGGDTQAIGYGLVALDGAPRWSDEAVAYLNELKILLLRAGYLAETRAQDGAAPERVAERKAVLLAFNSWQERFEMWMDDVAKKNNIKWQKRVFTAPPGKGP
jgi:membrane associated rhomboid family serine protease